MTSAIFPTLRELRGPFNRGVIFASAWANCQYTHRWTRGQEGGKKDDLVRVTEIARSPLSEFGTPPRHYPIDPTAAAPDASPQPSRGKKAIVVTSKVKSRSRQTRPFFARLASLMDRTLASGGDHSTGECIDASTGLGATRFRGGGGFVRPDSLRCAQTCAP